MLHTMDLQSEQESVHLHELEPSSFRRIKSEHTVPSFWEPIPSSIYSDTPISTYTSLETYMPNLEGQTYINLSSPFGFNNPTLPSMYLSQPVLAEDSLLSHNYGYNPNFYPKVEDEASVLNYDEGIGSSSSSLSPQHSPLSMDAVNRSTPQSIHDSGFEELPPQSQVLSHHSEMRHHHNQSPPATNQHRNQCIMCGTCKDGQLILDATGSLLCSACYNSKNGAAVASRDPGDNVGKIKKKSSASSRRSNQMCTNCLTSNTSLWRRNFKGDFVCNACGLYEKLHKKPRPEAMRKDVIQTRKRRPRNVEGKKKAEADRSERQVMPAPTLPPYPHVNPMHQLNHHMSKLSFPSTRNQSENVYNYLDQYQINYIAGPATEHQPHDDMST